MSFPVIFCMEADAIQEKALNLLKEVQDVVLVLFCFVFPDCGYNWSSFLMIFTDGKKSLKSASVFCPD